MWCLFRNMRKACSLNTSALGDPSGRRESMTTWGMLVLAVFVCMGMGEWSKRMAASEVILDEKVLQQAITIAAERKMEDRAGVNVKVNVNESGVRKAESGNLISKIGNEAATIQTSAGE